MTDSNGGRFSVWYLSIFFSFRLNCLFCLSVTLIFLNYEWFLEGWLPHFSKEYASSVFRTWCLVLRYNRIRGADTLTTRFPTMFKYGQFLSKLPPSGGLRWWFIKW